MTNNCRLPRNVNTLYGLIMILLPPADTTFRPSFAQQRLPALLPGRYSAFKANLCLTKTIFRRTAITLVHYLKRNFVSPDHCGILNKSNKEYPK